MEAREKKRLHRESQLKEQKIIDETVERFKQLEKERAMKMAQAHADHRKALDKDLEDRVKRKEERKKIEEFEDYKRKVFNDAKKVN